MKIALIIFAVVSAGFGCVGLGFEWDSPAMHWLGSGMLAGLFVGGLFGGFES